MKRQHILTGFFVLVALIVSFLFGSLANAQIIDDTQPGFDKQTQIMLRRQADIRKAKAVVERVFTFRENVPEVRLTLSDLDDRLRGRYTLYNREIAINLRERTHSYAGLIAFHEIGHWFDNRVLAPAFLPKAGSRDEASSNLTIKQMGAWRTAIAASATVREINRLLSDPKTKESDKEFLRYVVSPQEMFARSFCQYVTLRSGDDELQMQLSYFTFAAWPHSGQWKGDDFKPIEKALDELFASKGLLRTE